MKAYEEALEKVNTKTVCDFLHVQLDEMKKTLSNEINAKIGETKTEILSEMRAAFATINARLDNSMQGASIEATTSTSKESTNKQSDVDVTFPTNNWNELKELNEFLGDKNVSKRMVILHFPIHI